MTFRTMRRHRQQLSEPESIELLKNGTTAVLGVNGDDGYPYTVPINYVWHEGKIYLHCAKSGYKLDALRRSDKVSMTLIAQEQIVPQKLTTYYRSVILFGRARILTDVQEIIEAVQLLGRKYSTDAPAVDQEIRKDIDRLCCIEITIEHLSGKTAIEWVDPK